MGMWHVLLMVDVVEPSNILSRITFGRYKNFNLFFRANVSFTKPCDDPESKSAQNGQSGLQVAWDVSDRKKELGERDVAFRQRGEALVVFWQPVMEQPPFPFSAHL